MTREEKINTLKVIIQECEEYQWQRKETLFEIIKDLEQEPAYYPPCIDCNKKMNEIRNAYDNMIIKALKQKSILDKIQKVKSEIADLLAFWDYSPNNNLLARDMLKTLTDFWRDIKAESEVGNENNN